MKILFVAAANSSHTVKWVNLLAERGHGVVLASLANHCAQANTVSPLVRVEYLQYESPLGYYTNALQLRELAASLAPDVTNAHYASGYGTLARRAKTHPLLLSIWGSDVYEFPKKNRICRRMLEKNLSYANVIASTSLIMAKEAEPYMRNGTPVYITPFGVDTALFCPVARPADGEFVVGTAKRLEQESGLDIMLRAFRLFRTRMHLETPGHRVRLHIYGAGSEHAALQKLAHELRISDDTTFFGQIANREVAAAFSAMDVVCFPSRRESFGVAAVEAMACGRPVVVSPADGFLETVEKDVTGIILEKNDENHLAQALLRLYTDPLLRRAMGEAGRRRAVELYSSAECTQAMEEALVAAARFGD